MNYDLTDKQNRRRFIKRANRLLAKQRNNVRLIDESDRTLEQNSYIHVLCRILALDTGVSERYAKQVYFKQEANRDIFISVTKDPITNKVINFYRSTSDLTITEMSRAISNFIIWAAEQGYVLPEATIDNDGNLSFVSEKDRKAYHQAQIHTSQMDENFPT